MGIRRNNKRTRGNAERGRKITVRTCSHDGIRWHVPDHLIRVRGKGEIGIAKFNAGADLFGGSRGAAVRAGRLVDERNEALRLCYCPLCGSDNWRQEQTKAMPPPVEMQRQYWHQAQPQPLPPPPQASPQPVQGVWAYTQPVQPMWNAVHMPPTPPAPPPPGPYDRRA